ncbi:NAD(P)H-dependent oxidoreductase [Chengkuizengella axinellae]|uniref:NAD(P)H-dependent oxidoreductase n=1 Tax=Chengkuizengella axinellae TaxID=3064388 RepID=A0ABT9IW96_9BACL|nr:NAD(P)H-dependent oxidoreductase [Chengkuizengella sp. 2205SS18-9]MDP5273597.1 NAD(P)H-dependent oxidoreductase [Chengkuizengella sp. 2205SS18-9]
MKHLVIYAHPNPQSFNNAIKEAVVNSLKNKGHEVEVRDLYALGFQPVLNGSDFETFQSGQMPSDIQAEQEHIKNADVITFIYPIWWTGLPAILKGYIDRVFAYGFAYSVDEQGGYVKHLTGKKGLIINTTGAPTEFYDQVGMTGSLKQTSDTGILDFVGIEAIHHQFFGAVPTVDDATRKGMLVEVEKLINEKF